ncbi:hypothetical protein [Microbacterium panaciterrae]|uniref:Uncharacterized protein n=1 Tax=Microbacterium panaciterrae TaxID=985759 RepID=A0ABP8PCK1_9MICO
MSTAICTITTEFHPETNAKLRLVTYTGDETGDGQPFTEWQVISGGVCVARLTAAQIKTAMRVTLSSEEPVR